MSRTGHNELFHIKTTKTHLKSSIPSAPCSASVYVQRQRAHCRPGVLLTPFKRRPHRWPSRSTGYCFGPIAPGLGSPRERARSCIFSFMPATLLPWASFIAIVTLRAAESAAAQRAVSGAVPKHAQLAGRPQRQDNGRAADASAGRRCESASCKIAAVIDAVEAARTGG